MAYRKGLLDRWEAGNLKLVEEQELRGRILAYTELHELTLSGMKAFYGLEPTEEDRAKT